MTSTASSSTASSTTAPSTTAASSRPAHRKIGTARPGRARGRHWQGLGPGRPALGRYIDRQGHSREVVARRGFAGSVLVIDRDSATLGDRRLVAHLGGDEPPENAELLCRSYLEDASRGGPRPRRVTPADARTAPFDDPEECRNAVALDDEPPLDRSGRRYQLEPVQTGMSIPELRWRRYPQRPEAGAPESVSVREAIARLESYEPIRGLTRRALALHRGRDDLSSAVLRVELARMLQSPIVLNRRLREVALARVEREG
jgi:hypothetical protein